MEMTQQQRRRKINVELSEGFYDSPIGCLRLVSDGQSLLELSFALGEENGAKYFSHLDAILEQTRNWLDQYFVGQRPSFTPPLAPQGTAFQELVWQLLLAIPYGSTTTYGALAQAIAKRQGRERMSAQAVGQAVGSNPIAIIIPCHRVLGSKGQLTGYAWGLERKEALLGLEQGCKPIWQK